MPGSLFMVRFTAIALASFLASASAAVASDRLQVPGGMNALRAVMGLPSSVSDDRLLVEAVRAWYGARDVLTNPPPALAKTIEHLRASMEPMADGPPLGVNSDLWTKLLKCQQKNCRLGYSLLMNRNAMLLYHGLIAMDPDTRSWMEQHPALLRDLLEEGAAAFAFAGPFVHVRGGAVILPGGDALGGAWSSLAGEHTTTPEPFIRELMRRDAGRRAWLFSVLAQLDDAHSRFALAEGEKGLPALARYAASSSPEWIIAERPFWRTPFDLSFLLSLVELTPAGVPRGSQAFWREVFRSDDLSNWRSGEAIPLNVGSLLELIFEQPNSARERWEVFCLGQRLPGVEHDGRDAGLMLRGARRHPALAQMLDRIGISAPEIVLAVHRASSKISERDPSGERGELGAWQGALAIVERATLSGGLDAEGAKNALSGLGQLPLSDLRSELTAWLMDSFVGSLATRPGAPPDAERLVLQAMSGRLTPKGPRQEADFAWEDLKYSFGAAASLVTRMETARAAQRSALLDDARVAWRIEAGAATQQEIDALIGHLQDAESPTDARDIARRLQREQRDRDLPALKRDGRRAAESIVMAALPALAYVPHLAVTETPELGADIAFRHEFVAPDDGQNARKMRPWQVARGQSAGGAGWRLQGSLLMLDVSLTDWYLRRNGEPGSVPPMFDEGDMTALAQVAAMARSAGASRMGLADAAAAVDKGRARAASAASMADLDHMLEAAGLDPWRRWALASEASDPSAAAGLLTYGEAWRVGGAPGNLSPHQAIDGGAHFGAVPRCTLLMEGRRSAGAIGATAVDGQLRVARFLLSAHLPDELFGDVLAGLIADLMQNTPAARPDDFHAFGAAVMEVGDARLEEHLLALVADGTLARPTNQSH